ncbi:MAG: hypothetical protein AB7Q29_19030 [Vicinamibacterales bacterium]
MIGTIAWKSLLAHPVRTAVLGIGFGLGVGVMATLLGVGEVVLMQARAPALSGGGQLVLTGAAGPVTSARFVLNRVRTNAEVTAASPRRRGEVFLHMPGMAPIAVTATGGVPSLERALGDPETGSIAAWTDEPRDAAWATPNPADVVRAMDRFHPVPDVPARAESWAEWLYFKGRSGEVQCYITFLVGPARTDGKRIAGVRLQLDRDGRVTSYAARELVDEAALLRDAPDLTVAGNRVRLEGLRYRVTLALPPLGGPGPHVAGELVIDAVAGRSLPPIVLRGEGGWVSGYTVPVMSGALSGSLSIGAERIELAGTGYHDHNWGFWEGVSWRWGQVQHGDLSFVYGRVIPPADAADPARLPGFLVALGPDGPIGYSSDARIQETDDPATGRPTRIEVSGRGQAFDVNMEITVEDAIVTPGGALAAGPDFLQLRARYHVTGRADGERIDFVAPGAAETFRK